MTSQRSYLATVVYRGRHRGRTADGSSFVLRSRSTDNGLGVSQQFMAKVSGQQFMFVGLCPGPKSNSPWTT